jgi:hypothetical protein
LHVIPGFGFIFAAVLSLAAILIALLYRSGDAGDEFSALYDALLGAGFIAVPFAAYAATKIGNGSLSGRYLLSMILGVAIAFASVLRPLRNSKLVLLIVAACLLAGIARQEVLFWRGERGHLMALSSPANSLGAMLGPAGHTDLPVAVSDGQSYVQLAYYAPAQLGKRLVGIVDPANAIRYAGSDSVDRQMSALTCCLPLQVYRFRSFSATHPNFLLYSDGSAFDWWPTRLRNDGYSLERVASDAGRNIYWVRRSQGPNGLPDPAAAGAQ